MILIELPEILCKPSRLRVYSTFLYVFMHFTQFSRLFHIKITIYDCFTQSFMHAWLHLKLQSNHQNLCCHHHCYPLSFSLDFALTAPTAEKYTWLKGIKLHYAHIHTKAWMIDNWLTRIVLNIISFCKRTGATVMEDSMKK